MSVLSNTTSYGLAVKSLVPGGVEQMKRESEQAYNSTMLARGIDQLFKDRAKIYIGITTTLVAAGTAACTDSLIGQVAAGFIALGGAGLIGKGAESLIYSVKWLKNAYQDGRGQQDRDDAVNQDRRERIERRRANADQPIARK